MNFVFDNEGLDTLQPIRLAGFGGRISWNCVQEFTYKKWRYEIQSVRSLAIISKAIFLPHRLVRIGQGKIPGLVLYESDSLEEVKTMAQRVQELSKTGFEETISIDHLQAGDVIHVPSSAGRHYAFFDGSHLIEYQPNKPIAKGSVQRTSLQDFKVRLGEANLADVRRTKYINALDVIKSVQSAQDAVGTAGFHLLFQNCETFATWAKTGAGLSRQAANNLTTVFDWVIKLGIAAGIFLVLFIGIKYGGIGLFIRKILIDNGYWLAPNLFPKFVAGAGVAGLISVLLLVTDMILHNKALLPKNQIQ